ncbi:MAG: FecR domain-containing protein [Pseudomonadota bacterium]|nr:FecR domain-containing protein [Pseudomonadota bacterium]
MPSPTEPAAQAALDREAFELCRRLHEQPGNAQLAAEIDGWRRRSHAHESSWRRAQSAWQASGAVERQRESFMANVWLAFELWTERQIATLSAQPLRYALPAVLLASLVVLQFIDDTETPAVTGPVAAVPPDAAGTTTYDYASNRGERRSVNLPDGSTITLNWDTALRVTLDARARRVELQRGEALFAVAPDAARPFTVEAGSGSVTAVGTAFSVRHASPNELRAVVTEGIVRVEYPSASALMLEAGYAVVANERGIGAPLSIDTAAATAWTDGMLVFQDVPLEDAIAELGRYTSAPLRPRRLTGSTRAVTATYFTERADDALVLIAQAFELELTRAPDGSVIIDSAPPRRP